MTIVERPASTSSEAIAAPTDETPWGLASTMRVRKRDGTLEPVDVNKIVRAVGRAARGLDRVDPMRVATRTISGLYDGATTRELDELSIRTAAALVSRRAQLLPPRRPPARHVHRQGGRNQDIHSFSQSIAAGHEAGLIDDDTAALVANNAAS